MQSMLIRRVANNSTKPLSKIAGVAILCYLFAKALHLLFARYAFSSCSLLNSHLFLECQSCVP